MRTSSYSQSVSDAFKSMDKITLKPHNDFHFDNDIKSKTFLGACCTLLLYFCMLYISYYFAAIIANNS